VDLLKRLQLIGVHEKQLGNTHTHTIAVPVLKEKTE
jgi:hypothetical protein